MPLSIYEKKLPLLIMLAFCLFFYSSAHAQESYPEKAQLRFMYVDLGFLVKDALSPSVSANVLLSNNWGGTLNYVLHFKEAKELPGNYSPGLCIFSPCNPTDDLHTFTLRLARRFHTNTKLLRFGIEAGPSFLFFRSRHFVPDGGNWFSSNYDTYHTNHYSIGLSLKAFAEVPLCRYWGPKIGLTININQFQPYIALEVNHSFGYVRDRLRFKKINFQ